MPYVARTRWPELLPSVEPVAILFHPFERSVRMSKDPARDVSIKPYWGPVGGWGSAKSVAEILLREAVPLKGPLVLWE